MDLILTCLEYLEWFRSSSTDNGQFNGQLVSSDKLQ